MFPPTVENLRLIQLADAQRGKLARICKDLEGGLVFRSTSQQAIYIPAGCIHVVFTTRGGFLLTMEFSTPESACVLSALLKSDFDIFRINTRKQYFPASSSSQSIWHCSRIALWLDSAHGPIHRIISEGGQARKRKIRQRIRLGWKEDLIGRRRLQVHETASSRPLSQRRLNAPWDTYRLENPCGSIFELCIGSLPGIQCRLAVEKYPSQTRRRWIEARAREHGLNTHLNDKSLEELMHRAAPRPRLSRGMQYALQDESLVTTRLWRLDKSVFFIPLIILASRNVPLEKTFGVAFEQ
jgi:hypothetical protein